METHGVQFNNSLYKLVRARYEGTETLKEGYAMCYDVTRGTVTAPDGERAFVVEKPSLTNMNNFAGWVAESGEGKSGANGPVHFDLVLPGSVCNVWAAVPAVIDATRMTVCAGQWYMYHAGFAGKGSGKAVETVAGLTQAVPGLVQMFTDEGPMSGGVQTLVSVGGNLEIMHSGVTYLETTLAGDAWGDVPDGLFPGQLKLIQNRGAITNDVHVIYTTYCDADNWVTFNGVAGDAQLTIWTGVCWCPMCTEGADEASTSPVISPVLSGDNPQV